METINGEWIMKGCAANDPLRLKTVDDLLALVSKIGFLPLFESGIKGFSVEERTTAASWWTGDRDTDPWEWRTILSTHPEIAYGKFFDKKAGFIHKDFFPVFANYRRNGYDFESLFDDELASYRAKRIMDAFELNDEAVGKEIMSNDLKDIAGFGKDGGEKNFSGILTELQMQTYLIVSDFRQRTNKKGEVYGWHIAVMETPETKWGYDFTTSAYSEKPSDSWEKIAAQIQKFFPDADEKHIRKPLAIKYPGTEVQPVTEKKKAAPKPQKSVLTYPYNLLKDIGNDMPRALNEDQIEGLRYAVSTLKPKEQKILKLRYEDNKTYQEISEIFSLSRSRVGQINAKALSKLRHPSRLERIKYGFVGQEQRKQQLIENCRNAKSRSEQIEILKNVSLSESGFSPIFIKSTAQTVSTLGDFIKIMDNAPSELTQIFDSSEEYLIKLFHKLGEYRVDCSRARESTGINNRKKKESISELDLSCRTFNYLKRSGIDSIEQLEILIRDDPESFLRIRGLNEKSREELLSKLEAEDIDVSAVRKLMK